MWREKIYKIGVKRRNPSLWKKFHFLKESETWSRQKLEEYQLQETKRFLEFAETHSPFYKSHFAKTGFKASRLKLIDDLKKIAPVTKKMLIEYNADVHTKVHFKKKFFCETSGTSGQVLTFWRDEEWDSHNRAAMFRGYSWFNVDPWDRNLFFWGKDFSTLEKIKTRLFDSLQNRNRLFSYSDKSIERLRKIEEEIVYIHGYSSMIYEMARIFDKLGVTPENFSKLKLIKGTSEKIYESYQPLVIKVFGQPIVSEYGAAEAGIIAFECREGNMHIHTEGCVVEEEDDEILVTNFLSYSFPVIRYKLGDYIKLADKSFMCPCGMQHPILLEVEGRVGKNIYGKQRKYPSLTLYYVFKNLALNKGIKLSYQGIQHTKGKMELGIEQEGNESLKNLIEQEMTKYFGDDLDYNIRFGVTLKDFKGKFRDFISTVSE